MGRNIYKVCVTLDAGSEKLPSNRQNISILAPFIDRSMEHERTALQKRSIFGTVKRLLT